MKNLLFFSFLFCFLLSCSKDEKLNINKFPQKWELVKTYNSGFVGDEGLIFKTGADMEWQEYYLLNSDGTSIIKHRKKDGKAYEASGKFVFKVRDGITHLEITYDTHSWIILGCYGDLAEDLFINSENYLQSSVSSCDGGGFMYELIQ